MKAINVGRAPELAPLDSLWGVAKKVHFSLWRSRITLLTQTRQAGIDPLRVLSVDPAKIRDAGVGWGRYADGYDKSNEFGRVISGNWDLNVMPFEHLDVYQSFQAHFVDQVPWVDTSHYRMILAQLQRGLRPWGIRDSTDLERRLQAMDQLYTEIRDYGYRSQRRAWEGRYSRQAMDEVTVRIGRQGQLLFEDGRHRLTIAKLLRIPTVPVMVTWRHTDWVRFRRQILDHLQRHPLAVPGPLLHPDLSDIQPVNRDAWFQVIKAHLPVNTGRLLEIGAGRGYLCHRFAGEGFQCYVLEPDVETSSWLEQLGQAEEWQLKTIGVCYPDGAAAGPFDVVLALHGCQSLTTQATSYHELVHCLRRLDAKVVFFRPPSDESKPTDRQETLHDEDLVRFVADQIGLARWECISCGDEGPAIYKLTRN